jgi:predicted phosphodiesterase
MVKSFIVSLSLAAIPAFLSGCGSESVDGNATTAAPSPGPSEGGDKKTTTGPADTTTHKKLDECKPGEKLHKPSLPDEHNGAEWPMLCVDESEAYFMAIGDWGGMCNFENNVCGEGESVKPMKNNREAVTADKHPQQAVAHSMKERAQKHKPEFILSLGDHFYPGGIDVHCGATDNPMYQWNMMFEDIYDKKSLGVDWMGVLGNHDYGGTCFVKGWDQQISYTWHSESGRWVMPAQYFKRTVQFAQDFQAEFFFLDTNLVDAMVPSGDPDHNICSDIHNSGTGKSYCPMSRFPSPNGGNGTDFASCPTKEGMFTSVDQCHDGFKSSWAKQREWLEKELSESTADWQIVVTHYPPAFPPDGDRDLWPSLGKKYGIDLLVTGHTHSQGLYIGDDKDKQMDMSEFPYIISGGGGGIFSEGAPTESGEDDEYGFVDFKMSKDALEIMMVSHTGKERRTETIKPRQPASSMMRETMV